MKLLLNCLYFSSCEILAEEGAAFLPSCFCTAALWFLETEAKVHQRPQHVLLTETVSARVDDATFVSLQDGTLAAVSDLASNTRALQDCGWCCKRFNRILTTTER